jgi:hypothetical protein
MLFQRLAAAQFCVRSFMQQKAAAALREGPGVGGGAFGGGVFKQAFATPDLLGNLGLRCSFAPLREIGSSRLGKGHSPQEHLCQG